MTLLFLDFDFILFSLCLLQKLIIISLVDCKWIRVVKISHILSFDVLFINVTFNFHITGSAFGFSSLKAKYFSAKTGLDSQYLLSFSFPITIFLYQSSSQRSRWADLTLVMVGPNALCAPEQLEHSKTPKSREAPLYLSLYRSEQARYSLRRGSCWGVWGWGLVFFFVL